MWRATYEETPYNQLPWFDPDPSPVVVGAVEGGFLPAGAAVLDIGCGAGSNVLYLARKGFRAHGIDISPGAIRAAEARAQAEGLTIDVRTGDALAIADPAESYGGLVDIGCFHTIPIGRRPDYAREVARILRPDGSFVLSWVAREHEGPHGPPHRPSLEDVTKTFEARFLFTRTEFHGAPQGGSLPFYSAWMVRRSVPQPAAR